jgi:predicted transcriptional regulator
MAVVSIRLNKKEERVLDYLADYYHEDKSTLFKKSLFELYEDIQDIKLVKKYIKKAKKQKPEFITAEELLE